MNIKFNRKSINYYNDIYKHMLIMTKHHFTND
jgi:hypothetical protein